MTPKTLGAAFTDAYGACYEAARASGDVEKATLKQAIVLYVKTKHRAIVDQHLDMLLEREADRTIDSKTRGSRPTAMDIQQVASVAQGQLPLPTIEAARLETYVLPDGRLVSLLDMSIENLQALIALRQTQIVQNSEIVGRLNRLLAEMQRRGVQTVRELLA